MDLYEYIWNTILTQGCTQGYFVSRPVNCIGWNEDEFSWAWVGVCDINVDIILSSIKNPFF